jgi:superfamily II DNA/RNA helicase
MLTLTEKGRARARMPRTMILEPTRELAAQVEESFNKYGINHKLNVALLIGGVSFEEQMRKLDRGADVLIATPGRLLDLFERGRILMNGVEILVIDEADRMLDMGFIPDIERIVKMIPFTRQTLFFSATMPPEIKGLADKFLHNPVEIAVAGSATTAETVTQRLVSTPKKDYEKRAVLRELLGGEKDMKNAIIFCNRKRDVATLYKSLQQHEYSVGALHGDMDQRSRTTMLSKFRDGEIAIMVASDVAARGLDIPNVSHVFNYDVPIHAEDYIHRIGRTGRAGREGDAFTLVAPGDQRYVDAIEKLIGQKIDWLGKTSVAQDEETPPRKRTSRRKKSAPATKNAAPAKQAPVETVEADTTAPTRRTSRPGRKKQVEQVEADIAVEASTEQSGVEKTEVPVAEPKDKPVRQSRTKNTGTRAKTGRQNQSRGSNRNPEGMGEHVPAFMMRSAKPEKTAKPEKEVEESA